MELIIKQLKQDNKVIIPQTTAEAVLVKNNKEIITLDRVLNKKLETITTPAGSGLTTINDGTRVIITHANEITPNQNTKAVLIKHDSRGHIIDTKPMGKLNIVVDSKKYKEIDGESDHTLSMGDDFTVDNDIIKLKWNNLNGTT